MDPWIAWVKRQPRDPACVVVPRRIVKSTVGKVVANEQIINRCIDCIFGLIEIGYFAQAAAFLFQLNKTHFDEWFAVQKLALRRAKTVKELQMLTLIFQVSTRDTLEESAHLLPGLSVLLESQEICELLN